MITQITQIYDETAYNRAYLALPHFTYIFYFA